MFKKCVSEFIGTMVLVIFGCGSAVAANTLVGNGKLMSSGSPLALTTLLIAFAFGLSIVAMAYSIGNVSGCHINPAVSFGMLCAGRMSVNDFIAYVISQFLGGIAGAGILAAFFLDKAGTLGSNGWGQGVSALGIGAWQAFIVEVVLTFVFVIAILGVTSKDEYKGSAGIVIGLTLTLVHILGIPFTGTSVNPARSFGPALISCFMGKSQPITQVWLFIIAPLVGAAIAALVYNCISSAKKENANAKKAK